MAVKIGLTPRQTAALFLAASAGVQDASLTDNARHNASTALNRIQRRMAIHGVKIDWADEKGPKADD